MELTFHEVQVDTGITVRTAWASPADPGRVVGTLVLAHGAGAGMDHEFICYFHETLASKGVLTVKFNFPYMEQGRKIPDPPDRLEQAFQKVLQTLPTPAGEITDDVFIGGKSMGGRIATMVAAGGLGVRGLVLLGYPLHPPGREERLRVSHFHRIECPCLFLQGTRDPFCNLDLLEKHLTRVPGEVRLHRIEGADHSFHVSRGSGRNDRDVREEMTQVIVDWIAATSRRLPGASGDPNG